jgi:O-antigen ligase
LKKLLQYIPSKELYFFGLLLFAASLPLSKFTISLAQFIIAGNWVLEGHFKSKWDLIKHNKVALLLMSLYAIHLIGLWNTSNFDYALHDLKTKVPLLVFPFLMATSKALDRKQVNKILFLLCLATLVSTLISLAIYAGFTGKEITDIRQISPLISHIRLALLVCVAIAIAFYFYHRISQVPWLKVQAKTLKILLILSVVWMILFLIILESLTGLFVLMAGFFVFCLYKMLIEKGLFSQKIKYALIVLAALSIGYLIVYFSIKPMMVKDEVNISTLPKTTKNGNAYTHFVKEKFTENGHFYGLYQCAPELKKAWNTRSTLAYDSLDEKEQLVNFTLMRYLTSKNLPKDSIGVAQLTLQDINHIENGIPNYKIPQMNPLESRAYQVYCEYQSFTEGYNSSGHSLTMRLHYWQAAVLIIKDHFFTGVGTGDLEDAFQSKYVEINSPLELPWRHRAHNQYLTMMVAFGIFGVAYFMFWLFAPAYFKKGKLHPVYFAFLFILLISMLFEDTLETQAGLSFAVFFSSLFLLEDGEVRNINS